MLQGELRSGLDIEILEGFGTVLKLSVAEIEKLLLWWNGNLVLDLLLDNGDGVIWLNTDSNFFASFYLENCNIELSTNLAFKGCVMDNISVG